MQRVDVFIETSSRYPDPTAGKAVRSAGRMPTHIYNAFCVLEGWAREGLTDEQIARNMGISRSTLNQWKEKYSDISDTLKRGKEVVDLQVENALLTLSPGYHSRIG